MSIRKLLLVLGIVFVIAGLGLALVSFNRVTVPVPQTAQPAPKGPALLTALHAIPSGTLLREGDIGWKEVAQAQIRPGQMLRGEFSETEFLGAITRRDFAEAEPLLINELVKPNDRRFLSAVLRPGHRAVSISVDASNSASGLVLPGDFVDVILTQNFGDNIATIAYRSAGETVLRNVRVVAVDQSLGAQAKPAAQTGGPTAEARVPKTISLELDEHQAQMLFVATQLGKLQLAVRPLEGSGAVRIKEGHRPAPVWASDVSRAIVEIGNREVRNKKAEGKDIESRDIRPKSSGSTLEGAMRFAPPYASR